MPAEIAVSVGRSPTMPTTELIRISAFFICCDVAESIHAAQHLYRQICQTLFQFLILAFFENADLFRVIFPCLLFQQCNISICCQSMDLHIMCLCNFQRLRADRTGRASIEIHFPIFSVSFLKQAHKHHTRHKAKRPASCVVFGQYRPRAYTIIQRIPGTSFPAHRTPGQ